MSSHYSPSQEMAKTSPKLLALLLLFHILITMTVARPVILEKNLKNPESFFDHDRGYLIPGIGRGIKPKCKDGFNPFTYNPVTGGNDGFLGDVPTVPSVGGRSYVPGGDDTFVPNPGVEVPNPGNNGGISPSPSSK
ncbi:unnamed protein product [Lactuca saligna]|uniref:Cell wall protein n=1 Tax=Lactuca saligna TaxID=75948 RepID=A0AA36DYQ8_LACSI|nr:unnamed protein product [Lactuca saligna]